MRELSLFAFPPRLRGVDPASAYAKHNVSFRLQAISILKILGGSPIAVFALPKAPEKRR
jgi:hypothetical protein